MASPKSKISRSRRGMRRAHTSLTAPTVHSCPNCSALMKPHHVCPSCGYYKGREVVTSGDIA
ncbi:MAG: 50S ribosomal protein L32 [Pseudobdellovibrionaceae bacterium]|nr:50S ribosomal protein L32 [Bdellovibrionales bacterium]USN48188.1 MAG: 50S ribosomal protein L32 [Pseudobdellovibrionaceae bacterium]